VCSVRVGANRWAIGTVHDPTLVLEKSVRRVVPRHILPLKIMELHHAAVGLLVVAVAVRACSGGAHCQRHVVRARAASALLPQAVPVGTRVRYAVYPWVATVAQG
jgi:hypothetical protein